MPVALLDTYAVPKFQALAIGQVAAFKTSIGGVLKGLALDPAPQSPDHQVTRSRCRPVRTCL
jgi:hypothetical protein